MMVRISVESDDRVERVEAKLDEFALEEPYVNQEVGKQVLWHAYAMARMRLLEIEKGRVK